MRFSPVNEQYLSCSLLSFMNVCVCECVCVHACVCECVPVWVWWPPNPTGLDQNAFGEKESKRERDRGHQEVSWHSWQSPLPILRIRGRNQTEGRWSCESTVVGSIQLSDVISCFTLESWLNFSVLMLCLSLLATKAVSSKDTPTPHQKKGSLAFAVFPGCFSAVLLMSLRYRWPTPRIL